MWSRNHTFEYLLLEFLCEVHDCSWVFCTFVEAWWAVDSSLSLDWGSTGQATRNSDFVAGAAGRTGEQLFSFSEWLDLWKGWGGKWTKKAQTIKTLTRKEQLMEKKPWKPRICHCLGLQCFLRTGVALKCKRSIFPKFKNRSL